MPTFPALDPEPPPQPWWRRLVAPAGVCVVAGGIAAGVLLAPAGRSAPQPTPTASPSATAHVTGHLLLIDPQSGAAAVSTPDGSRVVELHQQVLGDTSRATLSPDGDLLLTSGGMLFITGGGPGLGAPTSLIPVAKQWKLRPADHPWADHGRAVVLVAAYGGGDQPVLLETDFRRNATTDLGDGVAAAGDPTGPGALVAVPGGLPVGQGPAAGYPIDRLELRRVGEPPATLLTSRRFARLVGFPPAHPYALTGWFSPDGAHLVVVGDDLTPGAERHALAILTRGGTRIATATTDRRGLAAWWSPDGKALAYFAIPDEGDDTQLTILDVADAGHPRRTITVGGSLGECLWAPDDAGLACRAGERGWQLVDLRSHTAQRITTDQPGVPVAWLPGQGQ